MTNREIIAKEWLADLCSQSNENEWRKGSNGWEKIQILRDYLGMNEQAPSATVDEMVKECAKDIYLHYKYNNHSIETRIKLLIEALHSQQEKRYTREFVIKLLLSVDDIDAKSIISDERTAGIFLDQFDSEGNE